MKASLKIKNYFEELKTRIEKEYNIASKARSQGRDPEKTIEIEMANNMAEMVVKLVSVVAPQIKNKGIEQRILELEKKYGLLDWRVCFTIALEVAQEKYCKFETKKEAIETGIRIGFAYVTLGVVSSPLDGFISLEFKKRRDNRGEYFCLNFAGPVRNAGGTGAAVCVLIADYVRKKLNYDVYDADEKEIKRAITELQDYHERVTNLQYYPSVEEITFLLKNIPVEIGGEPSEKFEVSNYKDLPRIPTNLIRSGYCLILSSCIPLKAPKLWKQLSKWGKDFEMDHWNFLEEFLKIQKKVKAKEEKKESNKKISPDYTYINELVAGRPVLGEPLKEGGFRLRYGRSRISGYSSHSIHPATKLILNKYLATGTQLKLERPGKATSLTSCDLIEGPIVRLKNGDVIKIKNLKQAKQYLENIDKILFLGDILISYGDFLNRAHNLIPSGYCEEWWSQELEKKDNTNKFVKQPLINKPTVEEAFELSKKYNIPLHPEYTYHWKLISKEEFKELLAWFEKANIVENKKIVLPLEKTKELLEKIGLPHIVIQKNFVIINHPESFVLKELLLKNKKKYEGEEILEYIREISGIQLRDKSGTFIGARMGRPEKAKIRKLTGSPHMLFPVGEEGGKFRSIQSCLDKGKITGEFARFYCKNCLKTTIYSRCEYCDTITVRQYTCKYCGNTEQEKCKHSQHNLSERKQIRINELFNLTLKKLGMKAYPDLIKGVRGTSNKKHIPENIAKGVLRAKNDIYVNKDGTTRYDMTQLPITHFKPEEIGTSIRKLRELGYEKDIEGKPLLQPDQIVELLPQDIILPTCEQSLEEGSDKVLYKTSKFIDDLLKYFYNIEPFYNLKNEKDLIGHLVVCLAPHTSVGTVGRIIGFSKTQGFFAHPLLHAATRRDCVFYDTKLVCYNKKEKTINYFKIGDYVEKLIKKGAITQKMDKYGTLKVYNNEELYVYGVDPIEKKLKKKKVKYFIKGPKPKYWIKITTITGREFSMTPNHKFIYYEGKKLKLKKASFVKVGDKIPVLKNFNITPNYVKKINLVKLLHENLPEREIKKINIVGGKKFFKKLVKKKKKEITNLLAELENYKSLNTWCSSVPLLHFKKLINNKIISYKKLPELSIKTCNEPSKFSIYFNPDENFTALLGYYIAKGCSIQNNTGSQVIFKTSKKEIQERISYLIKKVFKIKNLIKKNNNEIIICNDIIYYLFTYCLKINSNNCEKKIPSFLYTSSLSLIKTFISAYFDNNGIINNEKKTIIFHSLNKSVLDDIALLLARLSIFGSYHKTKHELSNEKLLKKSKELNKKCVLYQLIYTNSDVFKLSKILKLHDSTKRKELELIEKVKTKKTIFDKKKFHLEEINDIIIDSVKSVEKIKNNSNSYCLEINWKSEADKNILWGEQILNARCDGDELSVMLLMDSFLNFSRNFLPSSRGATMDAPLVLRSIIIPGEVDDMVFDLDIAWKYPLELYEKAQQYVMPWEVKIPLLRSKLDTPEQYENIGFTHDTTNLNNSVLCSAYKILPTMKEKLLGQMDLAEKIRAVNESNVAKLVIEKHFLKDLKGNLRKFSNQVFRCVDCNAKYRRPPLIGRCTECHGNIIFTVSEGSILKYLEPTISLAKKYKLEQYLVQTIDLLQKRIQEVFGKEKEKQLGLRAWFN